MKIVIDIPEELYKRIPTKEYIGYMDMSDWQKIIMSVSNGTPLPEGHGRLIDADKIANELNDLKNGWDRYGDEYESGRYESYDYAVDSIEGAFTIIEADNAEREDRK